MNILLDPAILFFVFGILAGAFRSNLEIPPQIVKFLSLYLLMALGLKGGYALNATGFTGEVLDTIIIGVILAIVIPLVGLFFLRKVLNEIDAAAVAATYGSVSAVTFITATQVLTSLGIEHGGHMAAVMAIMESPAIVLAMIFANRVAHTGAKLGHVIKESVTDGVHLLLIGAMVIGFIVGPVGQQVMAPFSEMMFKGMLAFFLLDMGLLVAKNFKSAISQSFWVPAYAIIAPIVHAAFALVLSIVFGVSLGNAILLMVLAASASYIAVPAVLKHALPQANPTIYFGMSIGITFPMNILIGIPLYISVANLALT